MRRAQDTGVRDHQMLAPSPGCILNCQALSIHLPPLTEPRGPLSPSKFISSPMSQSTKYSRVPSPPPTCVSYDRPYSDSLVSSQPLYIKELSQVSRDSRTPISRPQNLQREVATVNDVADPDLGGPLQLTHDVQELREGSFDEFSSATHDSPEARHLAAGPPGIARRAKAHVPSACVNCKRKHLACETRRPCNRCVQSGKEATCIDVQHKKRGRPRLREDESSHEIGFGHQYTQVDLYSGHSGAQGNNHTGRHGSKSYRELRSQPDHSYGDARPGTSDPRYPVHQSLQGIARPSSTSNSSYLSYSTPTVLLTPDFMVAQHNQSFAEALSLPYSAEGQALIDLVIPSEKEKIQRLQITLRAELLDASQSPRRRGNHEGSDGMPAIETLDLGHATAGFRSRSEYWTFRLPKGQSRGFPITISLARTGAHYLILTLVQSSMIFPSPHLSQTIESQQTTSPPAPQRPCSSEQGSRSTQYRQSNGVYPIQMSAQISSPPEGHTLAMQPSPRMGLDHYRHKSPPRTNVPPYTNVQTSPSSESVRSAQVLSQDSSRENLRHLQLPPIRTAGTGMAEPLKPLHETRTEPVHGKQHPSKWSPLSGRKKKRQRVEIGDILR